MADTPSRLSDGMIYYKGGYISIEKYRDMISARNLYNLDNEYENTQLFSSKNQSNVAQSILTVLNVIPQYNRMQVNSNLLGNTYDAFRDEGSALAKIGLIMLGKQMAYNSAMNLSVKYIPSVDLSQVLKGNPKGIFKLNEDNTITVKNKEDRTFTDKIGGFLSNFLGIDTYDVFGNANPFSKNPTNIDYIRNTGEAQLTHFYQAINMNIYKPINYQANSDYSKTFIEYSKKVGVIIDSTRRSILSKQPTFTFDKANIYPYLGIKINPDAINIANWSMDISYSANTDNIQEYAPTKDYILKNFGDVVIERPKGLENYVDDISNFNSDNSKNNLVWGRDGVSGFAEAEIGNLRGTDDSIENTTLEENESNYDKLSARTGLLEYTRNLLNATSGKFVDITRKAFDKDGDIIGFQGSPLWRANDSKYAIDSGNNTGVGGEGKTGVRQHTTLDPYDKFAKLIRFKGNVVYNAEGGNKDSVVYKTVLPRIHPTVDNTGGINNKNLMFSIENLAIGTVKRPNEKYGIIDDEYGTPIPLSEVGPFAGRLMWFPPYNLQINEVAIAKYESTVMVGRSEPMYNYMNSERSAVLSFSLIVDYPEQLRNLNLQGDNRNKAIADFFAFGGDPLPPEFQIEVIEQKIEKLKEQIPEIGGPEDQSEPPNIDVEDVSIYFPNDMPIQSEVDTVINIMYNNMHYEIIKGLESAQDGNGFGLNDKIYFISGLTEVSEGVWELTGTTNQYSLIKTTNQEGVPQSISLLNKNLLDVFNNENFRKYYDITIVAGASKLYLTDNEKVYNEALGNRRVAAAKKLVVSKLTAMFGKSVADELEKNNIKTRQSAGSTGMSDEGAIPNNMHNENVKKERSATISFARNSVPVDKKEQKLTEKQKTDVVKIQADIQNLELQLALAKKNLRENVYNERSKAILNGFESISANQFYPIFHSQTPEDFHRRLTFLQQCTRQGAAKRYDVIDENGELRARNSVFGRQPICILRVGDFFYTKIVIDSVTIDYADTTWDMNPEGFGMQPMMANITLQMKLIGGQSLKGPIDALQNAVTFNYYANSNFSNKGVYARASSEADKQEQYISGVIGDKTSNLNAAYDALIEKTREGDK